MPDLSITKIVRTRRRSVGLKITENAELIIHAPRWVSVSMIEKIVREKAKWIERARKHMTERPRAVKKKFIAGEQFLFRGESYPLSVSSAQKEDVIFDRGFFVKAEGAVAHEAMQRWYKDQAQLLILPRIAELAKKFQVPYQCGHISRGVSRWGSCSSKNSIRINRRLIMAPPAVLDYVICHELAHVKQKNHSPKFWAEVERMMGDWKEQRLWLRKNGHSLSF